ncbi:MAG: IPT/TIG domain-containing protein [Myxococcota bacterium]|nr:IPT/TIG domain-containing protein [Myxococcota bacterium]MDW8362573.1 IPT/TIG domain-containing protein [Myxococcales bacterium]
MDARTSVLALALVTGSMASSCGGGGGEMGIVDIQPRSGSIAGERPIQIKGYDLRTDIGYTVYFGNKRAPSVTIIDPETLLVVLPSREQPGRVDVTVLADSGQGWKIRGADGQGVFEYLTEAQAAGAERTSMGNLAY